MIDISAIRLDFPILSEKISGKPLIYLDNAATSQKPLPVIAAIDRYLRTQNSNIHRAAHHLANISTELYETSRSKIAKHLGVKTHEINFTRGTTESINLLKEAYGMKMLEKGDAVLISEMEHHANIVPWLDLKEKIGIELRYIPMNLDCTLDLSQIDTLLDQKVKLVSIQMISNAIGTIHPVEFIIQKAKSLGARVHLDIAQVVSHQAIDLSEMNIDFASFSGHKVFAPFGIGVFWGREDLLNQMNPYHFGGEMIKEVYMDKATYNDLPYKFEAGTPNVMGGIALAEAFDYIDKIGMSAIEAYESSLYEFAYEELSKIEALQFHSPKGKSIASLSFSIGDIHPFDIGQILDAQGIAIRTGHHCAQPIMRKLGIEGTCRASICFYNTEEEILALVRGLKQGIKMLS